MEKSIKTDDEVVREDACEAATEATHAEPSRASAPAADAVAGATSASELTAGSAQSDYTRKARSGKALSQTMKELKVTRSPLSKTLAGIKLSQESLQSAAPGAVGKTPTSMFRLEQLMQHGRGSLAYSSLQAGLRYFMAENLGYIAYVQLRDSADSVCVLADPICARDNTRALLEAFLKEKKDPVFLHISHETAQILSDLSFCVNELGVETIIDLDTFTLTGNKKEQLRRARNGAKKDNLKARELEHVDDPLFKALKKISDDWLNDKTVSDSEMKFVVRPLVYVDEIDVRRFIAVKDGEIVGFVIFDPMYENGEVVGYIANQLRSNLDRSYSVVDFIILEAMDRFKAEGKKYLSLGLSPLYKVDDSDKFKHSKLLQANFKYAFEKANFLYNFQNLARHKSKYRPELPGCREEKVYCAMHTRFLLVRMFEVAGVLGLHPFRQTLAHLWSQLKDWLSATF